MPKRGDAYWMQEALQEASKGVGLTAPNPPVGAVIVRDGICIGRGWHQRAGEAHAEPRALADAVRKHGKEALVGARIYITLEPCSSFGKTPPCTEAIIQSGITEVVYGLEDPDSRHAGRAREVLERRGILVISGVMEEECAYMIRGFVMRSLNARPWVKLKIAMSLDGNITRPSHEGQWLSSPSSLRRVQAMRYAVDAIITGGNTVRCDNPALTLRGEYAGKKEQPWRAVITRNSEKLSPRAQLFCDNFAHRTCIYEGIEIALEDLGNKGCNHVLLEAGGGLVAPFLERGLIDEVALFYAPLVVGGLDRALGNYKESLSLYQTRVEQIEDDILLRANLRPSLWWRTDSISSVDK